MYAHKLHDDVAPQELEAQVKAQLTSAADGVKDTGLVEYDRGRIAALNAIRRLLQTSKAEEL